MSKSHPVPNDEHLLLCYHYIELSPVRVHMAPAASDYPWSGYPHNACGKPGPLIRPHPCYLALASNDAHRQALYRDLIQAACDQDAVRLAHHLHHHHPMGNDRLRAAIEAQLGRSEAPRKGGRPRKVQPRPDETRLSPVF